MISSLIILLIIFAFSIAILVLVESCCNEEAQAYPTVRDTNLSVETYFDGLKLPSNMAFLGIDDLLVLEKDTGKVRRIVNGNMLPSPLLEVNVSTDKWSMERGLLGIAISNRTNAAPFVFLYFTEFESKDGEEQPLGNRLYRYELENNKLVNPTLLLDLPAYPGEMHNGGAMTIGPDNNIYLSVGDIGGHADNDTKTQVQNFRDGSLADGRAGILRISQDGKPIDDGLLGEAFPERLYYAYGIRNSFGIDFDPVTGHLWDTENGPLFADEINLVEPGFNSGWMAVQGIWKPNPKDINHPDITGFDQRNLYDFEGHGIYSEPEFIWNITVGPTALKFFNSDSLGERYKNDIFIGDVNRKNLYHLDLNDRRTKLALNGSLSDGIANSHEELEDIIFAEGFGRITDIEVGPDGYLYVLSYSENSKDPFDFEGAIHRIGPSTPG